MLDWHSCQICYPFDIKILLLLLFDFNTILIQSWHFVSSVAQKRNPPNFNNFSCV